MSLDIQPKTRGDVITSADFNAIVSAVNANETATEQLDSTKQDTLIGSGTGQNIKTVGGESILGTGDIPVGDDAPIQSISVNGNDVPPDENGNVAITAYPKPQTGIPESDLSVDVQKKLLAGINTQAISEKSMAVGNGTIAGSKCFRIISVNNKVYTFDNDVDLTGFAPNDVFSVKYDSNYDNVGKIVAVDNSAKTITVDTVPNYSLKNNPEGTDNTFRVSKKPTIGNIDFGVGALAEGDSNIAAGDNSHAEGKGNVATGRYSHVEGKENEAAYASHAEGFKTQAFGQASHAEGRETQAQGNYSHSEGQKAKAIGVNSHAEGASAVANGDNSHAEGGATQANGVHAHAEGRGTVATGANSHSEGNGTVASGEASHAEGLKTQAFGQASHAEGNNTKASSSTQHVQGKYNIEDDNGTYAHIVGNGSSSARSNAHTLDWDGNGWYAGDVVGNKDGTEHKLSEKYAKPQTGIPESDLSADVQAKLNDDLAMRLAMYGKAVTPSNLRCAYVPQRDAYEMTNVDTATTGDIVVPYQYDDGVHGQKAVYGLGRGIFEGCAEITSITFPKTITVFNGGYIFKGCSKLKSVTIPDSVTYFAGSSMFENCTNLISVTLPDGITYFGNEIFKNRPANLVVYCNKGSAAESYCKTNNVPYAYNDFKDKQDIDKRKLKLYYHYIAGYSVLTAEPSDWSTNYTNYYTLYGTSTSEDMAYVAVTGEVAPTFVPRQYYRKATGTTVNTPWFSFPKITEEAIIQFVNITSGINSAANFVDENGKMVNVPVPSGGCMHIKLERGWLYADNAKPSLAFPARIGEFGKKTSRWNADGGLINLNVDGHIKIYTPVIDGKTYYQIGTAADYAEFVTMANADPTINGILTADIDLSDWTGDVIGIYGGTRGTSTPYTGTFDGNEHVIKNLTISKAATDSSKGVAMFAAADGATIKNLGLENALIENTGSYKSGILLGGILGMGYATTVENCYVKNSTIQSTSNKYINHAGPIAGYISELSLVNNCYSTGNSIGFSTSISNFTSSSGTSLSPFVGTVNSSAGNENSIQNSYARNNTFLNLPSNQKRSQFARFGTSTGTYSDWVNSYAETQPTGSYMDSGSSMTKYATDAAVWSNGTVLAALNNGGTAWKADTNNVNGGAPRLFWEADVYNENVEEV